jgi:hypothetical protein
LAKPISPIATQPGGKLLHPDAEPPPILMADSAAAAEQKEKKSERRMTTAKGNGKSDDTMWRVV